MYIYFLLFSYSWKYFPWICPCYQSFPYLLQLKIALSLYFIDYSRYNEHIFIYFCSSYKLEQKWENLKSLLFKNKNGLSLRYFNFLMKKFLNKMLAIIVSIWPFIVYLLSRKLVSSQLVFHLQLSLLFIKL